MRPKEGVVRVRAGMKSDELTDAALDCTPGQMFSTCSRCGHFGAGACACPMTEPLADLQSRLRDYAHGPESCEPGCECGFAGSNREMYGRIPKDTVYPERDVHLGATEKC